MKTLLWIIASCAVAISAGAQNRPPRYQYVARVMVKPAMTEQYEAYVKKVVEAAEKLGDVQNWTAFNLTAGGPGGQYAFVLPFETWAERDSWTSPRDMLVKAFGEDEAAKIVRSGSVAVAGSETSISEFQADISSERAGIAGLKKNYRVSRATVKPERANDYRVAIAKIRAAQDKAGGGVYTGRRVVEGNRWIFTSAVGFDSGAERDQWPGFREFMGTLYSDREIDQILDAIYRATVESTWFEVAHRPELSHQVPAPTSN